MILVNGQLPSPVLAVAGTATIPAYSFFGDPDTGFYNNTANQVSLAVAGAGSHLFNASGVFLPSNRTYGWNSGAYGSALDLHLSRVAAGSLGITGLSNGQVSGIQTLTELTTIAAAAFTDTTIQIPANCLVEAVTVRVTVIIPTATVFDVGIAGATTRFATGVLVAANTTDAGISTIYNKYTSAVSVRFTPDAQPAANTGRVRVTIHYRTFTAATS